MSLLAQNLLVGAIVLAAVAFLVWRRLRRRARPSAPCGDCPGCATGPQVPAADTLVTIGGTGTARSGPAAGRRGAGGRSALV